MTPTLTSDARDSIAREVATELAAARHAIRSRLADTLVGDTVETGDGTLATIVGIRMDADDFVVAICTHTDDRGVKVACEVAL